MAIFRRIS